MSGTQTHINLSSWLPSFFLQLSYISYTFLEDLGHVLGYKSGTIMLGQLKSACSLKINVADPNIS